MEAISRIGNSLAPTPTNRCTLRIIEGLGGELKVVDRNDISPNTTNERRKDVGSKRNFSRLNVGVRSFNEDT
jgi:hypothetical protein